MASREERFWSKVAKGEGCWEWQGARTSGRRNGGFSYGKLRTGPRGSSRIELAHRVSWELAHGPMPVGSFICHHCDNPPCVRPDHLFLGSPADNTADRDRKLRHGTARLTPEQVRAIRAAVNAGARQSDIARAFAIVPSAVSQIVHRKAWKHLD